MNEGQRCERCEAEAKVSITDGHGGSTHHYCAQHVPGDLNEIIETENRRQQARKQKLTERAQELRSKWEEKEMEPELKAELLGLLDFLLRLGQR
ncbi:MAG TPA: hypothetical protein VH475_08340 [Tepidisphaeraceae bacterium]|jgi:hypothetical protein